MPVGPTLIEEVERMNAVMMCPNQRVEFTQCNPYAMDMDRTNRNCGGFGYIARNCRNRGTRNRIGKERRLKYR